VDRAAASLRPPEFPLAGPPSYGRSLPHERGDWYRRLFETMSQGAMVLSAQGVILEANPAATAMFEMTRDELLGRSTLEPEWELHHPGGTAIEPPEHPAMRAISTGFPVLGEELGARHRPSGRRLALEVSAYPEFEEGASFPSQVLVTLHDVTARRNAEDQYRHLILASMDAYLLAGPEGRILDASGEAEAMLGYGRDDLLRLAVPDLEMRESAEEFREHAERIRRFGWDRFESRLRHRDGRGVDVEVCVNHVPTEGGRFVVFLRDITARRREERVEQSRVQLLEYAVRRTLEETLVATLDAAEELTDSCIGFYHFLSADQATLTLQAWSTRTSRDYCRAEGKGSHYDVSAAGIWVDCVRRRRSLMVNEYARAPHRRGLPEGHAEVLRLISVPVFRDGSIVAILGVGNKRTPYTEEDVRIVERLADVAWELAEAKRAAEHVRESESRLQQAKTIAGLAIWEWDMKTDHLVWSDEMLEIFGIQRAAFTALGRDLLPAIHPDDRPLALEHLRSRVQDARRARTSGRHEGDLPPHAYELRVLRPDGSLRWVRGDARPQLNDRGEPVRVSGVLWDVTTQHQAEEERSRLERRVHQVQRLESLGVLAGGIAHDFNNLLMGVLGHAELALERVPEGSATHEDLAKIVEGSRRAAELCELMLAYAGRGRPRTGPVDLGRLVEETLLLVRASVPRLHDVELALEPRAMWISGDPAQLRQVLMNLVLNASEAIGEREGRIRVSGGACDVTAADPVDGAPSGPCVWLEVRDDGCGMDAATLDRIFDPFFTTKFAGRGLGLSAVRGIVRSHQGSLEATSEPGRGSCFRLVLPRRESPASAAPAATPPAGALDLTGTALVVDDEPAVRTVTSRMLERMGLSVVTANDGAEGVRRFEELAAAVRLVVLDQTMPHLGGVQALEAIRRIRPEVPVVLVSGYAADGLRERFAGMAHVALLQKPFDFRALGDAVTALLGSPAAR
jgi:two-component system cell cycle sensor histidine kinase/response regulator CckA